MGQSTISIRVDEKLKKSFDELCDSVGLSNTAAFTVFMKAAVRERRIPFELRAETEAEIRAKSMEAFEEMRRIARQKGLSGMSLEEINEELVANHLTTAQVPDPDLLIRTSGELRISNFLLWQLAYSELYFTPCLWPEFTNEEFYHAIVDYQHRERRFGKTSEQI